MSQLRMPNASYSTTVPKRPSALSNYPPTTPQTPPAFLELCGNLPPVMREAAIQSHVDGLDVRQEGFILTNSFPTPEVAQARPTGPRVTAQDTYTRQKRCPSLKISIQDVRLLPLRSFDEGPFGGCVAVARKDPQGCSKDAEHQPSCQIPEAH